MPNAYDGVLKNRFQTKKALQNWLQFDLESIKNSLLSSKPILNNTSN